MRPNNYGDNVQVYTLFKDNWQVDPWDSLLSKAATKDSVPEGFEGTLSSVGCGVLTQRRDADPAPALRPFVFILVVSKLHGGDHLFLCRNIMELQSAKEMVAKV